ncbi:hypothetical protein CGT98_17740 [Vibrio metoecus]|nr:hypothetical protein CGT98_17740 [Vibrio metoecus]
MKLTGDWCGVIGARLYGTMAIDKVFPTMRSRSRYNKRLKRDCQRVAFPVPLSRGGYGCCV